MAYFPNSFTIQRSNKFVNSQHIKDPTTYKHEATVPCAIFDTFLINSNQWPIVFLCHPIVCDSIRDNVA